MGHWNDCNAFLPTLCGSGDGPLLLCVEHVAGLGCGSGDAQAVGTTAGSIGSDQLKMVTAETPAS